MDAQECARYILELPVSEIYREKVRKKYGLEIEEGATYFDLLQKRWIQLAESGDPEAVQMVKELGFIDDKQKKPYSITE